MNRTLTIATGLLMALALPAVAVAQSPPPLTLTLAIANDQGEPSQPAIDAFIDQVAKLSKGSIVIDPLYGAGNGTAEGFEAGVAGLVERGEADLALNASRAWDLEGVTSLQALQAPFLITDGALATAVATSDIATRALAGMAAKGVTGLTLWPEDLRHPFALGAHAPFLSPDDFKGANILVQPSALSRSLITTLGGTLYVDGDREADAAAGILQGAESGLLQGATLPGHPTATGDVTFYPKFQVISANAAKLAGLTPEQQDILRAAAAETQRLTIAAHTSEADAAAAWCADGGAVVLAGADGVAAFEAAAKPVFDAITKDPLTAQLITDIKTLKATTAPAPGASACNAVVASPSPVPVPTAHASEPAGSLPNPFTVVATLDQATTGLVQPEALAFGPDGNLYVADFEPSIRVISPSGQPIRSWGKAGAGPGEFNFNGLASIAVGADGLVYVLDRANHRVQVFQPNGKFVRQVGSFGGKPGQFVDPSHVAVDGHGAIFVIDDAQESLTKFHATGAAAWVIGGSGETDSDLVGHYHRGSFDSQDRLWLTNDNNSRVVAIDEHGKKVDAFGEQGTGPGQFEGTFSVAFDASDNAYVDECSSKRLQVLDPQHQVMGVLSAPGGLPFGESYAFGPDGLLYALAAGDHCAGALPPGSVPADILVMKVTLPGQGVPSVSSIPDGTYTTIATKEDALRTGWQDDCALLRDGNHLKLVLEGGKFTQLSACQGVPENVGDEGTYRSTADRLVLTSDSGPSAVTMAWALTGDVLTLHVLDAPDPLAVAQFLYEHAWTRVP